MSVWFILYIVQYPASALCDLGRMSAADVWVNPDVSRWNRNLWTRELNENDFCDPTTFHLVSPSDAHFQFTNTDFHTVCLCCSSERCHFLSASSSCTKKLKNQTCTRCTDHILMLYCKTRSSVTVPLSITTDFNWLHVLHVATWGFLKGILGNVRNDLLKQTRRFDSKLHDSINVAWECSLGNKYPFWLNGQFPNLVYLHINTNCRERFPWMTQS